MNFFFRTNFNQQIGIGHLVRSLRIYDKLRLKNNCKIFVDQQSLSFLKGTKNYLKKFQIKHYQI